MPPEINSYPRPNQKEIEQVLDRLAKVEDASPEEWMLRLERLSERKGGSLQLLLPDWMERMLEHGMFAGWEAEDLNTLRGLLIKKQSRNSVSIALEGQN